MTCLFIVVYVRVCVSVLYSTEQHVRHLAITLCPVCVLCCIPQSNMYVILLSLCALCVCCVVFHRVTCMSSCCLSVPCVLCCVSQSNMYVILLSLCALCVCCLPQSNMYVILLSLCALCVCCVVFHRVTCTSSCYHSVPCVCVVLFWTEQHVRHLAITLCPVCVLCFTEQHVRYLAVTFCPVCCVVFHRVTCTSFCCHSVPSVLCCVSQSNMYVILLSLCSLRVVLSSTE